MASKTAWKNGRGLENFVYDLYNDLGYNNICKNVKFYVSKGDPINAEIDILYKEYLIHNVYVECKSKKSGLVPLEQFSKFCMILDTLNVPKIPGIYRGEMITNTDFDGRIYQLAESQRIRLINRKNLEDLEKLRKTGMRKIFLGLRAASEYKQKGIGGVLEYVLTRTLPMDVQLKKYSK